MLQFTHGFNPEIQLVVEVNSSYDFKTELDFELKELKNKGATVIKKILATLALLLVAVIVYAAIKPSEYFIKRDLVIHAKSDAIYPYLVSMKNADQWMPWSETDPHVKTTYSGPETGVGATSNWDSQGGMGTGKAEIVVAVSNQSIKTKITYSKPMEMNQDSEFILTPAGKSTQMTWTLSGKSPFIARLMCTVTFMNMDKYVGGMFEKGLLKLKGLVESERIEK
ncbi:MAG: SRPBCC family protein [Bdellovibrionota bacterium]